MAKSERIKLITPTFRASFPDVFVKRVFEGQSEENARYSCAALFSGFEVQSGKTRIAVPTAWTEAEQKKWTAIIQACNKVSLEAFKKPMKELDRALYKLPFHRGEEKEYDGYGPGVVYFTMSAKNRRPQIVARDGITPITQGGPDEFYAGCFARASVTPFAFNNKGKGIALGLNNLQKLGDGPRLDAFSSAEDDFGSDPAEFAGDDDAAGGEETSDDFA